LVKGAKGDVVTAVEEETVNSILSLYPNPTNERRSITIEISKGGMASLDLIDVNGQELKNILYQKQIPASFLQNIQLLEINPGLYVMKLKLNGTIYYKKVVIP
jgi:hypothetical protein